MSAVDEQTFRKVTNNIDDKVEDIKEFIEKKLKRLREMSSTNNVVPIGDAKIEELQNSIKEINNNFKKFQSRISEDISNIKISNPDQMNLFIEAEREAESKSRSKFAIKPDSPKKTNKSMKKSTVENAKEDVKYSEEIEDEKESSPQRAYTLEDELRESMERPLDEEEEQVEQKEVNVTRSSRHSTLQNQKIANQIDNLVGKEIEEIK